MHKTTLLGLLLTVTLPATVCPAADPPKPTRPENVSSAEPRTPEGERQAFHLPEGFVAELVAAEPEIHKPLNLAFDDQGRLWVTETLEYPFPAGEGTHPRDGVKILSDFAPDGRARTIRAFADGLNIPIGVLPMPSQPGQGDVALVHNIPNILRLSDTDHDGRADRREVLYATFGSKDTHGMTNAFTWGFDGWIYACHGFSNTSTVAGADHAAITMQSGNVYRMRPDGTHLEYFTHGQVNPFGLAFDPMGNLYSCDCHSKPIYQLLRGAWYPSFAKPDDGLGFGPTMLNHDHGSTAISGIATYAADRFPEEFRGTIFVGNVMTNRINHDRLEWHGSSPKGIALDDFLWSDDNWFRPVDIELGPDGALYVADFYNRIIGHYEVPLAHPGRDRERGRIWRIVYRGSTAPAGAVPGTGAEATRDALLAALGHPNLAVRTLAANQLAARTPDASLKTIVARTDEPAERRVHTLWILQRWGILDEETLQSAAVDPDRAVRVHALRVLGERPDWSAPLRSQVVRSLRDADPLVSRCAAEALGRHPNPSQIRALLDLRQTAPADDTHRVHAVRVALRDQLRDDEAWDRLDTGPWSDRDLSDLADVAPGVYSARAARFLLGQLRRGREPENRLGGFVHHVARYGAHGTEPELTAFVAAQQTAGRGRQAALLKELQQGIQERGGSPSEATRTLALEVARALIDAPRRADVVAGTQLATAFKLGALDERLAELGRDKQADEASRNAALSALAAIDVKDALPVLSQLLGDASEAATLREQAAGKLGSLSQPEAEAALLAALPTAPGRLQSSIAAALAPRAGSAAALLDAVAAGKASPRVLQEPRVALLLAAAQPPNLKQRLDALLKGLPPGDDRIRDLIGRRRKHFESSDRDPALGAQVFEKNCVACHQLKNQGARIGPQLDGIGVRGVDRLLEDILDPSRNVDQAFRTTNLALTDGRLVSGLLLREDGEVLVMADAQGKEVRVERSLVDEQSQSQLSPMPANFADQLAEADLDHLLAFLLANSTAEGSKPGDQPR
jgi:putative heme-binding domain-containing protein